MDLIPKTVETYEYSYRIANTRTVQMPVLATTRRKLKARNKTNMDEDTDTLENELDIHKLFGINFLIDGDTSQAGRLLTKKQKGKW